MKQILLFCTLVLFAFCGTAQKKQITLEEIWSSGIFRPKGIQEIRSMKDGKHYCILTVSGIEKYDYKTGKKLGDIIRFSDVRLKSGEPFIAKIQNYNFNANETQLLLCTKIEPIYRHSFTAEYYVYDLKSNALEPLSANGRQGLAEFSPNGKFVAFIRDNNLFLKDLEKNKETQITTDGKFNHIIYGAVDWVYEEEFAVEKGFFWSGNGQKLAFYRFDESAVKEYDMTVWGKLYPDTYRYKYPKAGEANSKVDVWVYDLQSSATTKLDVGSQNDQYIPRFQWTKDNNTLAIQRMNRLQNKLEILLANANTGAVQTIYEETNDAYIDEPEFLYFLKDKKHFLLLSEKDGYNHIYLCGLNNEPIQQITKGNFDVAEINAVDEQRRAIYFTSAESSPLNRDLYMVDFKGAKKTKLSKREGTNTASFSATCDYYINNFTEANTPNLFTINTNKGDEVVVLEDNKTLVAKMGEYTNAKKKFGVLKTSENVELNYFIVKPIDFDSTKKYPVLFYVYGGPGSQTVVNSFDKSNLFWFQLLAQKGYIVVSVDGRGTGYRGEAFKKVTYKQLGKYETTDQIEAAKYFASQSWVDESRIGIFGWSYGGYMSTLCLTKGADVFKTAIAVAPVTNWRYYDNIYTERYMRTPQENAKGYDDNSPIAHVAKMKGNYLLVHGTEDDNVHLQNAMDLITALNTANKQYEMFIYPNKNHSIYGGNTRLHLYTMMTNFLLEKL